MRVIVHGGAGRRKLDPGRLERYRAGLAEAAEAGLARLRAGGTPLDAVEEAVRCMEASGAFNAGRGSCLTLAKTIECDAAVMVGATGGFGGCGAVPGVLHPVTLARGVLERTDHLLIVGEGARTLAEGFGVERLDEPIDADRLEQWERTRSKRAEDLGSGGGLTRLEAMLAHGAEAEEAGVESPAPAMGDGDTVGAVAIDAGGRLAAAVSTGGLWLKLPGRVGDSAILGAGLYADDAAGAAVATGVGEAIWRGSLSRRAVDLMAAGRTAQAACEQACAELRDQLGPDTAGLIAIDASGRPGAAMNTEAMGRACLRDGDGAPWVAIAAEDGPPPGSR